jgi:hypothetical protein
VPLALLLVLPPAAAGQEVILQNDSFTSGGSAAFQGGFVAGEIGAVRLAPTGPFPVQVTKVQLLFGGAVTDATITLRIWDDTAGTLAPGTELFFGDYFLTASNTALQEIDLTAAAIMVSGPFRVGIQFQHDGAPSIARDADGISAAGRNFIYAGAWFDSTTFGIGGDWIIRAAVQSDAPIFADGFESGDLLAWSSATTDGGDLNVSGAAAMAGTDSGLRANVNDTNPLFVTDATAADLGRYRARFYLDPNGFDPGEGENHRRTRVFIVFDESPLRRLAAVVLRRLSGAYALMGRARLDDNSQADTGFVTISDGPHAVEIDWKRSSGPDANDGWLHLWIDGVPVGSRTSLDNNAGGVDFVRLGALSVKTGAAGVLYFDEFVSQEDAYIGP